MPRSFPPIAGRRAKVLILGTMPSRRSLQLGQYYGHPQNQFWKLLEGVLKTPLHGRPYAQRAALLKSRGIAVWDVLKSCSRHGSLDAAIRGERPNSIPKFAAKLGVKTIFFNGNPAFAFYKKHCGADSIDGIALRKLPSSSPAHAGKTLAQKRRAWRAIGRSLNK